MGVDPVTTTDPQNWKWAEHRLDATLGTRPTRSPVTDRGGTSQIVQYYWENLKRVMGSGMVTMYESAESGISPLMVIPRTTQEIEEDIRREEAGRGGS